MLSLWLPVLGHFRYPLVRFWSCNTRRSGYGRALLVRPRKIERLEAAEKEIHLCSSWLLREMVADTCILSRQCFSLPPRPVNLYPFMMTEISDTSKASSSPFLPGALVRETFVLTQLRQSWDCPQLDLATYKPD